MYGMTDVFSWWLNMSYTATMRVWARVCWLNLQISFMTKWWGFDMMLLVLSLRCMDVEDVLSCIGWERGWCVFVLMSYGLAVLCVWWPNIFFIVEIF